MDQPESVVVLARIPDLHGGGGDAEPASTQSQSRGRLLNPALSFALLAGGTALLTAVAVFGFRTVKNDQPADSQTAANPLPAWHPRPSAPAAETAGSWGGSCTATPGAIVQLSPQPNASQPTQSQPKAPAKESRDDAKVASFGEGESLPWQVFCRQFDAKPAAPAASVANQSMTLNRQSDAAREYQADARSGYPRERTPNTTYPETQTP
jgi:hypothetical protein